MSESPPPGIRLRRGRAPSIVVAPHGGRSSLDLLAAPGGRTWRTNDLFSDEFAEQLASALDASAIVNPTIDRNELDLNRLSAVRRRAPWLLGFLADAIDELLQRHREVELLFVHGWNVIQPSCDLGIGARLTDTDDLDDALDNLTGSAAWVRERLDPLRRALEHTGIATRYGSRWPAAHANNVMQLFRRGEVSAGVVTAAAMGERDVPPVARDAIGRLRAHARAGRVHAVQLELGVPLRWPGRWRDGFLTTLVDHLAVVPPRTATAAVSRMGSAQPPRRTAPHAMGTSASFSIQAIDHDARLAVIAGMRPAPDGFVYARLVVLLGHARVVLFVGERPLTEAHDGEATVGALRASRSGDDLRISFSGPALDVDDAQLYVRLEAAQARSRLVALDVELTLPGAAGWLAEPPSTEPSRSSVASAVVAAAAPVSGRITVDGLSRDLTGVAFTDAGFARPLVGTADERNRVLALVDGAVLLHEGPLTTTTAGAPGGFDPDAPIAPVHSPVAGETALQVAPQSRMTVLWGSDARGHALGQFGMAEIRDARGRRGVGFYERAWRQPRR